MTAESDQILTNLEMKMAKMTDDLGPSATVMETTNSQRLKLTFTLANYNRNAIKITIHPDRVLGVEGMRHTAVDRVKGDHHFAYHHKLAKNADVNNIQGEWDPNRKELVVRVPLNAANRADEQEPAQLMA